MGLQAIALKSFWFLLFYSLCKILEILFSNMNFIFNNFYRERRFLIDLQARGNRAVNLMKKTSSYFYYLVFVFCFCFSQLLVAGNHSKLNKSVLRSKIQEYQSSDSWAYRAIFSELSQFSPSELSAERMQNLFYNELSDPNHLIYIAFVRNNIPQIIAPEGRNLTEREVIILSAMQSLCRAVKVPDVTFLFSSHDSYDSNEFPVLTFSKKKFSKNLLMPDFEAMEGYGNIRSHVQESVRLYPWNAKTDKLFWRGATTGGVYTTGNYALFPRSLAVTYSLNRPDLIDARFTNVVQDTPGVSELLCQKNMMGDFVSIGKSLKYKYLVDIDGNANTYSRCFWILLSNSVLFKVDSEFVQWYYSLLQESHNYVGLRSDLSDLELKLNWMRQNDGLAEQIAANGTHIAEHHLSHEAVFAYFYTFLKALAAQQ